MFVFKTHNPHLRFLLLFSLAVLLTVSRHALAASGIDPTFDASSLSYGVEARAVAVQADGKILVAGNFDVVNGVKISSGLIRLNQDGSLDTSFNSNIIPAASSGTYIFIRVQLDGKIIVGGSYSGTFGGLVRLNPD